MKKIMALSLLTLMAGSLIGTSAYAMPPFEKQRIIQQQRFEQNRLNELRNRQLAEHRFMERKNGHKFAHKNHHHWNH